QPTGCAGRWSGAMAGAWRCGRWASSPRRRVEDGSFDSVCIPDNKRVSAHTYGNMVGRGGKPLAGYFAEARKKVMAEQHVHVDPEWETFTYGDPTPPKRS